MADLTALYSYKGQEPREIPNEIILSDGRSRTDRTTFTEEEILDAGFTGPYDKPEIQDGQQLTWNKDFLQWDIVEIETPIENPTYDDLTDFMGDLRLVRNSMLIACDWTQLPDSQLSDSQKNDWQVYRQELRDFPNIIEFDDNIESYMQDINLIPWPDKPNV